jgi:hypothetical protein
MVIASLFHPIKFINRDTHADVVRVKIAVRVRGMGGGQNGD